MSAFLFCQCNFPSLILIPVFSQSHRHSTNHIHDLSPQADGIDVSYLTSSLATQESVAEPDKPWDFDSLFTEVASFMQAELEGEDEKMEINK